MTQPAAKGCPIPARTAAPRIKMKPNQVTILGVTPVFANSVTIGWVITEAIDFLKTCSLAGDRLTCLKVEISVPSFIGSICHW
jgi:hypothetical protein